MKKLILALVLVAMAAPPALANSTFGIAWNPGITTGNSSDFASGFSFRGAVLEWRNFTTSRTAFGLSVGWNIFTESFDGTVSEDYVTATGKQWTYINAVPIHATGYYYFGTDRRTARLFAGLGAGVDWIELRREYGIFISEGDEWHFGIAPEIGVQLPWNSFLGFVSVRYQYAFEAGDTPAQSWFDFKIGFGLD